MKKTLLILWLIVLILAFIEYIGGASPTWFKVFCPLIVLILELIEDVMAEK